MTWDHPRAWRPLDAFDATTVTWDRQPLAGFEAHPITDLAIRYDLLVIDHPGLGAAVAGNALLPLDEVFTPAELAAWAATSVGPTWDSYLFAGRQWALPIDAATQVTTLRPGLSAPRAWDEVPDFAARHATALCLAGPHAFLGLLAMHAAWTGAPTGWTPRLDVLTDAIALLHRTWQHTDGAILDPIDIHARIAAGTLDHCPLVYGYAQYAGPVTWADAPSWGGARTPGTVLGGTGLALARRAADRLDDVRDYIRRFMTDAVQTELIPAHGGQPAHTSVWDGPGYYAATRTSVEAAYRRPRFDGWIGFQDEASALTRDAITGARAPEETARTLIDRYNDLRKESTDE